ncbi:mRNA-decapping enzyme subunit 2, partial [Linderina macrospora]
MFEDATFAEVLDDLASRFIINVPQEELQQVERICFQIEQAHWFYDDFVREKNPSLPSMSLKTFAARMFRHCPLLSQWAHDAETAYQTFLEYKFKVPVCGAIILNEALDKVLLVKGWSSRSSWGFPRGKINKDEPEWQCAQREVIEETGFDILPHLVENERIEITQAEQKILLYIITGIPEDTEFIPTTRKEISQIQWHHITDLPAGGKGNVGNAPKNANEKEHRYYLIKPFVKRIKTWISKHPGAARRASARTGSPAAKENKAIAPLVAAGKMSVQDLFKTVNRVQSPAPEPAGVVSVAASASNASLVTESSMAAQHGSPMAGVSQAGQRFGVGTPEGKSASLLQTLMGRPSGVSSPVNVPESDSKLLALSKLMQQNNISGTPPPVLVPPLSSQPGMASPAPPHVMADGSGFIQGSMMPMPMVAPFPGVMMAPHPVMHQFGM